MVKKTYSLSLDIRTPGTPGLCFEVVYGDTGNVIEITLVDGANPVDLSGCFVAAFFASGKTVAQEDSDGHGVTIDGNKVTIDLYKDSVTPDKSVGCELQVYSGDDRAVLITSAKFMFYCRSGVAQDDVVAAQPTWPLLGAAVIAEQGRAAAEVLRVTAEQLRETYHNSLKTLYQAAYATAVTNGYTGTETEFYALVADVYNSKISAAGSAASAAQALSDLLAMIGTDICPLVGGQVPVDKIPLVLVHNIVQITDESELIALTSEQVQLNDIATLIEGEGDAKKRVKSWQLLSDDPSVRANWVEVAVDYASTAAYATTAGEAENATMINNHRLVLFRTDETSTGSEKYAGAVIDNDTLYGVTEGT